MVRTLRPVYLVYRWRPSASLTAVQYGAAPVIDVLIDPNEGMRRAIYSPLALEAERGVRPA